MDAASRHSRRHVLLGNGFSIAWRPDTFLYGRLLDEANFDGLTIDADAIFGLCGTSDFERVIRLLRSSAEVLGVYDSTDPAFADRLHADADCVKEALAQVLTRRHPDRVDSVTPAEYASARRFLEPFDHIFTVSYDLLLYWTLLQDEIDPPVRNDDGFRTDPNDPDADWVIWDLFSAPTQTTYYLHGGLHLFDAGAELRKLTYKRTGIPLVEQIRAAMDDGLYPRVVTEGTSEEKLAAIQHSAYLHRGLRSLATCGGALFVHGHSLDDNDAHILRAITKGKYRALYVSLHGDPTAAANLAIQRRAHALADDRDDRKPLSVAFYDADSASVWR